MTRFVSILVGVALFASSWTAVAQRGAEEPGASLELTLVGGLRETQCATVVESVQRIAGVAGATCHNTRLTLALSAGAAVAVSSIDRVLSSHQSDTGVQVRVHMRNISIFHRAELVFSDTHDPANDAPLRSAIAGRRGVVSAELVGPRRIRVEVSSGNPLSVMNVVQTYQREVLRGGGAGRIVPEEIITDIVFLR